MIEKPIPHAGNAVVAGIEAAAAFAIPVAAVTIVWLLIRNAELIALALKSAPLIRKLTIYGIEIELDIKALENLEERERNVFRELSQKVERASTKTARSLSIPEHLRDTAREIVNLKILSNPNLTLDKTLRFTIHVSDAIFQRHIYQVVDYYLPYHGRFGEGRGRRFSIRYGIIGRCWRTGESQGVAKAFSGTAQAIAELKDKWSMTDAEAASAKDKPSCLAIAIHSDAPKTLIGILYADSGTPEFWGATDDEAIQFALQCERLGTMKNLRDALKEYTAFSTQIRIDLDLTSA